MKLTSRHDISAPLPIIYAQMQDFAQFERAAIRRGADIQRTDSSGAGPVGTKWKLKFPFRGKQRNVSFNLTEAVKDSHMAGHFDSDTVNGVATVELVALSPKLTRMTLSIDVKPKTLAARLVIQSMRIGKGPVQRRFHRAAGKLRQLLDERCREVTG